MSRILITGVKKPCQGKLGFRWFALAFNLKGHCNMIDRFSGFVCTEDVATITKKNKRWIQSLKLELIALGYAKNIGRSLVLDINDHHYDVSLFDFLTDKEKRNRERKKVKTIVDRISDWAFDGVLETGDLNFGGTVYLKPGFSFLENMPVHKLSFQTIDSALKSIEGAQPCNCEECQFAKL